MKREVIREDEQGSVVIYYESDSEVQQRQAEQAEQAERAREVAESIRSSS